MLDTCISLQICPLMCLCPFTLSEIRVIFLSHASSFAFYFFKFFIQACFSPILGVTSSILV